VNLDGCGIPDLDARGRRVIEDALVRCFNAHHEPIEFHMPASEFGQFWQALIDTATPDGARGEPQRGAGQTLVVEARAHAGQQICDVDEMKGTGRWSER
jgi:glycogen operon protein